MLSSKDLNFVGYTYKNFEAVQAEEAIDIGECFIAESYLLLFLLCWSKD